jgi:hypothetical protein
MGGDVGRTSHSGFENLFFLRFLRVSDQASQRRGSSLVSCLPGLEVEEDDIQNAFAMRLDLGVFAMRASLVLLVYKDSSSNQ